MNLHRAGKKPQWEGLAPANMNGWQQTAARTNGYLTPANVITIVGLILVIVGLNYIGRKHYVAGLGLVAIGRICDVLDGMVAEATQTKSPLGEALDATSDKIASLVALIVLAATDIIPWAVAILILLPNVVNALLVFTAQIKKITLHASKEGKLFMAYSWASLLFFIFAVDRDHAWHTALTSIAYIVLVISLWLGAKAGLDYAKTVSKG